MLIHRLSMQKKPAKNTLKISEG